ncbi:hypothetical protein DAEQUDRAFT_326749 [Daedalea quercina L-15889]|uniref:Uncharacterized protein n=1 Tax=Daedalea quercina L-15889 TaxID=1314783 RepID=A0A165PP25_9APHY|nr:hypothetical protein DAEQUDRAFT_326749 [Daedalea quercina L-15889]
MQSRQLHAREPPLGTARDVERAWPCLFRRSAGQRWARRQLRQRRQARMRRAYMQMGTSPAVEAGRHPQQPRRSCRVLLLPCFSSTCRVFRDRTTWRTCLLSSTNADATWLARAFANRARKSPEPQRYRPSTHSELRPRRTALTQYLQAFGPSSASGLATLYIVTRRSRASMSS